MEETRADNDEIQNLLAENRRLKAEIEARDCKRAKVAEFDFEGQEIQDMQAAIDTLMSCTKDWRMCAEKIKAIYPNTPGMPQ